MAIYLLPFSAFAFLAVLSQFGLVRTGRLAYGLGVLWIGLFAGLRFETGQDWPAYRDFFSDIGDFSPFESKFEIGYYLLNYAVKSLGGSYPTVLLLASLFCAFSVYRLTNRLPVNRFYILTVYMGYSFLILHFAQVRQSLAVGFFLLAVDYYLRNRGRSQLPAILLLVISPLFQISSLMYIAVLGPVLMWQSKNPWWIVVLVASAAGAWVILQFVDLSSLLTVVADTSTQEKLAIYQELKVDQSIFQVLYAVYLLILAAFLFRSANQLAANDAFVVRYAIASLLLTVFFALAFAGFYVFYSRAYAIACLFQGIALAIVFGKSPKSVMNHALFCISLLAACISYWRLLTFYAEEYTPYHTVFGAL
jgi:EpsG family